MTSRRTRRAVRFAVLLAIALAAAYVVRSFEIYRIPPVAGGRADQSLSPLYKGGSQVVCEILDADDPLERGMDAVYAMYWEGELRARFGRVRALPGDVVGTDDEGMLTVNGERIGPINMRGEPAGEVPEGKVYILAINPQETLFPDSRKLGFIDRENVRARIIGRWPFGR